MDFGRLLLIIFLTYFLGKKIWETDEKKDRLMFLLLLFFAWDGFLYRSEYNFVGVLSKYFPKVTYISHAIMIVIGIYLLFNIGKYYFYQEER